MRSAARSLTAIGVAVLLAPMRASAGENTWTGHGPENQDFELVAVAPTDPPTIFAVSQAWNYSTRLWRSTDGASSWARVGEGFDRIFGIAVHPQSPQTVYVAVHKGLWSSTDSGSTWGLRPGDPSGPTLGLQAAPSDPTVFYTTGYGLSRSTDAGNSWTVSGPSGIQWLTGVGVDPASSDIVYAATEGSFGGTPVYRSTDGARTWTTLASIYGLANTRERDRVRIAVDRADTSTVFLSVNGSLQRSTDSGLTWSRSSSIGAAGLLPLPGGTLVGTNGVSRSTDAGATWTQLGGTRPFLVRDLARDPSSADGWYAATRSGILHLAGNHLERYLPSAGNPMDAYAVAGVGGSGADVYVGTLGGLFKSTDGAETWEQRMIGSTYASVLGLLTIPGDEKTVLAASFGIAWRSTDAGDTWIVSSPLTLATTFAVAPSAPDTVYALGGSYTLSRSTDRGATWTPLPSVFGVPGSYELDTIAAGPSGAAFTTSGGILYSSFDAGASWTSSCVPVYPCFDVDRSYVTWVAVDPRSSSVLYLGTDNGLLKTADGGAHWEDITHGIRTPYIDGIVVDRDRPGWVTVASDGGVFRSLNGGASWIDISAGLPDTGFVTALAASPVDPDRFFAATLIAGGGHAFHLVLPRGDANGDGHVDVVDVLALLNALFAGGEAPIGAADVNGDGHVDVSDVFYLIAYLFASGPPPLG